MRRKLLVQRPSVRPKPPLIRVPTPPFGTHAAALDRAAALLELARARHHVSVARKRHNPKRGTSIGSAFVASEWTRQTLGAISAAAVLKRATGPLLAKAVGRLIELERRGLITPAEATAALEAVTTHSRPKVGHMPQHIAIGADQNTDLPPELGSYADGVSDDAAYHPDLIGCGADCVGSGMLDATGVVSGLGDLTVAGLGDLAVSGLGDLTVAGLGDLAVAGLPSYLFTRKSLANPVMRRRLSNAIKAMTPKLRRRVLQRLRTAVSAASRVAGIRSVTPSIGWGAVSGQMSHHTHVQVAGRCPYASVAGALTP